MLLAVARPTEGIQSESSSPDERLDSSLSREVLDDLQMSATTEHDREAAMPLLIPL